MKPQLSFRGSLIVLVFGSALLTFAKVILFPTTASSVTTSFSFPEQVPLPQWEAVSHPENTRLESGELRYAAAKHYRYIRNEEALDIDMYYFVNTDGDVKGFLRAKAPGLQLQNDQSKQTDRGYYLLFVNQNRAYLSACINPHGGSTVSSVQFKQNRNTADLANRLLPWLLGQGQLKDERCLWANLSVPLEQSSPETAYQTLESVWSFWQPWWEQHFPNP